MPVLAAVDARLTVSVGNSLLLHADVAARQSARGRGTTLELAANCKQLLYIVLAEHTNTLLAASAVHLAASPSCAVTQLAVLAMYCSANVEGTIVLLASDAASRAVTPSWRKQDRKCLLRVSDMMTAALTKTSVTRDLDTGAATTLESTCAAPNTLVLYNIYITLRNTKCA